MGAAASRTRLRGTPYSMAITPYILSRMWIFSSAFPLHASVCARVTPVPGEIAGARRATSLSSLRIADVIVRVPGVAEAPLKTCTSANSSRTFKPVPYWRAMCAAFGKRNRMLPNLAAASPESVPSCVRETGRKARSLSSSPSLGNSPACSSAAPRGREGLHSNVLIEMTQL